MITIQRSKNSILMGKPTVVIVNGVRIGTVAAGYALKLDLNKGDILQLSQGGMNRSAKMIVKKTEAHYRITPNPKSSSIVALMIASLLLLPPFLKKFISVSQNMLAIIIFLIFLLIEFVFNFRKGLLIEEIK